VFVVSSYNINSHQLYYQISYIISTYNSIQLVCLHVHVLWDAESVFMSVWMCTSRFFCMLMVNVYSTVYCYYCCRVCLRCALLLLLLLLLLLWVLIWLVPCRVGRSINRSSMSLLLLAENLTRASRQSNCSAVLLARFRVVRRASPTVRSILKSTDRHSAPLFGGRGVSLFSYGHLPNSPSPGMKSVRKCLQLWSLIIIIYCS